MAVAKDRGMNFYQILTLASIVEREAQLDQEKPLIAGVYDNRLDPEKWPLGLLQSDPTIFYIHDSLELAKRKVPDWTKYVFWAPIKGGLTDETLPPELAGYNTYTSKGLPPGPIDTPTLTSIDAALEPDTKDGYFYFLAKGDGVEDDGVRQDAQGARGERREVPEGMSLGALAGGLPVPADFAAAPTAADLGPLGGRRPGGPSGAAGTAPGAVRGGIGRRLLRGPPRAHALPDRVHPRRRRGEGGRQLRPVRGERR